MTGTGWARTDATGAPVYGREQVAHLDHVASYWREKHAAEAARNPAPNARAQRSRVRRANAKAERARIQAERARDAAMLAILKNTKWRS